MANNRFRKKDSARLVWDSKPRRAPNPKDIEFQTAASKKGQDNYTALMKLAKDDFAVLIDYWAVDWDYDGFTFKSQWQAFRGNGRKARTVPTMASETLRKKNNRTIAVRVVDIFGNDAGATIDIPTPSGVGS